MPHPPYPPRITCIRKDFSIGILRRISDHPTRPIGGSKTALCQESLEVIRGDIHAAPIFSPRAILGLGLLLLGLASVLVGRRVDALLGAALRALDLASATLGVRLAMPALTTVATLRALTLLACLLLCPLRKCPERLENHA